MGRHVPPTLWDYDYRDVISLDIVVISWRSKCLSVFYWTHFPDVYELITVSKQKEEKTLKRFDAAKTSQFHIINK